jgi:hypothetical protein
VRVFKTHCNRGHERTLDNLYENGTCKKCACLRQPEKIARILAKQKANPEAHAKRVNDWAKTESGRRSVRSTQLKYKYGLTLDGYEKLLNGQMRQLLCVDCNFGLGQFKDSIEILKKAVDYLAKHQLQ